MAVDWAATVQQVVQAGAWEEGCSAMVEVATVVVGVVAEAKAEVGSAEAVMGGAAKGAEGSVVAGWEAEAEEVVGGVAEGVAEAEGVVGGVAGAEGVAAVAVAVAEAVVAAAALVAGMVVAAAEAAVVEVEVAAGPVERLASEREEAVAGEVALPPGLEASQM